METKHTPGPWKFIRADDTPGYREPAGIEIGSHIVWLGGMVFNPRETEANGRLIACAPDLLNALQELLADSQHAKHHCGDDDCPIDLARAVIAKATGA